MTNSFVEEPRSETDNPIALLSRRRRLSRNAEVVGHDAAQDGKQLYGGAREKECG